MTHIHTFSSADLCPFARAWVDIPKGDLDSSGTLTSPDQWVVPNSQLYPYGTTELYPNFVDSNGTVIDNTGHDYAECSNQGLCDRSSGICACFDGWVGSACQYMSCPVVSSGGGEGDVTWCNGHGVCRSAESIANTDANNTYRLWDKDVNMACVCDQGYTGPNCNQKRCPIGFDPVLADQFSYRYSNWTVAIITSSASVTITGNFSLRFYDVYDNPWITEPIQYGASCGEIINALETLPGGVIPSGSVHCLFYPDFSKISPANEPGLSKGNTYFGQKYILTFPQNPGMCVCFWLLLFVSLCICTPLVVLINGL